MTRPQFRTLNADARIGGVSVQSSVGRAVVGVCAAMLPPEAGGPDPVALAAGIRRYLGYLPAPARAGVLAGAAALDALSWATTRTRLADLDVAGRESVLARFASTRPEAALALDALKATITLVAGADAYAPSLRERAMSEAPARPDADLDVTPGTEWPGVVSCDVVVVGSGAGGAVAARTLARRGLDVVVVEEGRRFGVDEFRTGHPADRFGRLYRDGGSTVAIGRPPVVLPIGRGVGGTTLVNSGTCYRTPSRVLQHWRDGLGVAFADPARFDPLLDEVEAMLEVAPVPLSVMGRNGNLLLAGAEALGWDAGPIRRNAAGCGGCCQCAIGCPRNAKLGVHLNALPDACAAGARIASGLRVVRVVSERGRATGVYAVDEAGQPHHLHARRVVVAAGATETPTLLRRSGMGRHPHIGRNLALHPAIGVAGRFDAPVTAWEGVLQSAAVEEHHETEGILIEATSTPPGMGSMALPGYGRELVDQINTADHLVTLGAMVGDRPSGRVVGRYRAASALLYDLHPDDGRRLVRSISHMGRLLFAAGATEVLSGVPGEAPVRSLAELDELVGRVDARQLHIAAFHPSGTARAGADEQTAPVAPDGRLRGVDGVWVADASVLPTCPEVNPQMTVMAASMAIAEGVR